LGIEIVRQRSFDKMKDFTEIITQLNLPASEVAFMGDDVTDIPVMRAVGFAVAVPNARAEVKKIAHYVTKAAGGKGAVREAIELILKASGKWKSVTDRYFVA